MNTKVKLTKEQKDYFLKAYMENELSNCLSYDIEDRIKYLGVIEDEAIRRVLFDTVNESVQYAEDVIQGYDDMYIECLNPNVKEQDIIVVVDDSIEGELDFIHIDKAELLKYVDMRYIEDVIRSWEYTLRDGYYHFGVWYSHDAEVRDTIQEIASK